MAIDRQGMIDAIHFGDAVWGYPVPWSWGIHDEWPPKTKEWLPKWYFENLDEAKKLLAEAGYANGIKANAIYVTSAIVKREEALLYVIDNLKRIGIEITPTKLEPAAYNSQWLTGNFENLVFSSIPHSGGGTEWEDWVYYLYYSKSPKQYVHMNDAKLDDLVTQAKEEEDEKKVTELRRQIFDYTADNMFYLPIVGLPWYTINHPYVQNWASNSYAWSYYYGADQLRTVWVTDDAPGRKQSY